MKFLRYKDEKINGHGAAVDMQDRPRVVVDIFNSVESRLAYHGRLSTLVEATCLAWPQVKSSPARVAGGISCLYEPREKTQHSGSVRTLATVRNRDRGGYGKSLRSSHLQLGWVESRCGAVV